jgi:hypothetical protein
MDGLMRTHNDCMMMFSLPNRRRLRKRLPGSLKRTIIPAALLLLAALDPTRAAQPSVTLAWSASPDLAVVGYHLYQGGASGVYTNMVATPTTSVTVANLVTRGTYFFVVTAYDIVGLESPYSSEIQYTVPVSNAPPVVLTSCHRLPTGNYSVSGTAAANQTCVLQAAASLAKPVSWTSVVTNTANTSGVFTCMDLKATNYTRRFYRVMGR